MTVIKYHLSADFQAFGILPLVIEDLLRPRVLLLSAQLFVLQVVTII